MMCTFLVFEMTAALLCGLIVYSFFVESVSSSFTPSATARHIDGVKMTTPNVHLALYWMRRSLTQPYRYWYAHDSDAYDTVDLKWRLPHAVVEQGHILLPFHVLYLRLCGQWLQMTHPDLARIFLSNHDGLMEGSHADVWKLQQATATVAAGCVVLIGAPASWLLMRTVTRLLSRAVRERERVAYVQLPAAESEAHPAAAPKGEEAPALSASFPASEEDTEDASNHKKKVAEVSSLEAEAVTPHTVHTFAVFLSALLLVGVGLLPLLLVEVCTLQPWCLTGSLLVWAVYAVLKDESQLHGSEAEASDDAFDLTSPVIEEGAVVFYALKQQPSVVPLVSYVTITTVVSLTFTSCLYITPLLFLWALTSCWQHGYKRVLVKVKASTASTTTADPDRSGYVRVGYSCYSDKLYMNTCFCYAFALSVLTVLLITTPWWRSLQPLLSFMDLFANPRLQKAQDEKTQNRTALTERSFTGALEMQARCLSGPSYHTCALPAANLWRLSEWFGLPWTNAAKSVTRLFSSDDDYVSRESVRWLEFATVTLAALANAASVLVLTFYRVRKPLLSFESPVRYAAERAAHLAEQQAYWEAKKLSRRGGTRRAPQTPSRPSAAGSTEQKRSKVITCLCREEYLTKQTVLLSWMLSLATLSGAALFMRNGPESGVLAIPCSSLMAAVYAVVCVLRRAHPLAFSPLRSTAARKGNGENLEGKDSTQQDDPSALTQQDRDDPRPLPASLWCTSGVAPSLSHVADVTWLQLIFVSSVLSTGALTLAVVPTVLRQVVIVCGGVGAVLLLLRLRQWAKVDLSAWFLFICGILASAMLWLTLLAQLFPQSEDSTSLSGYVSGITNRFGDMYSNTGETALRALIYQCAVACVVYLSCILYASLRIGRLALEPEEVNLVPIESELSFFSKPAETKKRQ